MTKWILMSFLLVGMIACKTTKMDNNGEVNNILSVSQGACFGDCPVYTLTVRSDGFMTLQAQKMRQGDRRKGNYSMQMSKAEYSEFARLYAKVKTDELENIYDKNLMDAPQTTFVFHKNNDKITKYKMSAPSELQDLNKYLYYLVQESTSWKKDALKLTEERTIEQVDVLNKDKNRFVVKLKEDTNLANWLKKYSFHNMDVEKVLSQNERIYLLNYKSTMSMNRIAEELRRDKDVVSMELHPAPKSGKGNGHGEVKIRTDKKGNK